MNYHEAVVDIAMTSCWTHMGSHVCVMSWLVIASENVLEAALPASHHTGISQA